MYMYIIYKSICLSMHAFIHPSACPSVCPCALCVYTIYVYCVLSRYYTEYVYGVCIWRMHIVYGMYTIISICLSIHACALSVYTLYVCCVCI